MLIVLFNIDYVQDKIGMRLCRIEARNVLIKDICLISFYSLKSKYFCLPQVLPSLMKLLAQLIVQLPKEGQNMILNDLYAQVAESDDVIRKPILVSWLQSLSYLCSQATSRRSADGAEHGGNVALASNTGDLSFNKINARL